MEVLLCNNYLKGISFFGALFLTSQQYFDLVFLFTYFIELYIFNYHIVLTNRTIVKTTPKDRVLKKRLLRIFLRKITGWRNIFISLTPIWNVRVLLELITNTDKHYTQKLKNSNILYTWCRKAITSAIILIKRAFFQLNIRHKLCWKISNLSA